MTQSFRLCTDRVLPAALRQEALLRALEENPANAAAPTAPGMAPSDVAGAVDRGKKWKPGRVLKVRFLDGDPVVWRKVEASAQTWSRYANIRFEFGDAADAEIRISFAQSGSWSYIGTDNLLIAPDQATMNFGWLNAETDDEELSRVVLHEFGHALGFIHEHQNPVDGIQWNEEAVLAYYMGAPNFWDEEQVRFNVLEAYSKEQIEFTAFDAESIMLYPVPKEFTLNGFEVLWQNHQLSEVDKRFVASVYPFE